MAQVRIIDVAREAGVSLGTVSNALNHPDRVRPETRRIINETIERLGYTPNQSARTLRSGKRTVIGLVVPELNHGAVLQIVNGATSEARKHGFGLLVASSNSQELDRRYLDYFMGNQVAGVLAQPYRANSWKAPVSSPVPVVCLNSHSAEPGWYVAADNYAQGKLIATHLAIVGATHVAVIGNAATQRMRLRLSGIKDAAAEYPDVAFEILDAGDGKVSGDGYTLARELCERDEPSRPDAILGLTDVLAAGAIAGVIESGLNVPADIAVAGCDGNPLAWGGSVALTTCAPPGYEIGRKGVQLLLKAIEQEGVPRAPHGAHRDESHQNEPQISPDEMNVLDGLYASVPAEPPARVEELVRPFLLARASTGAGSASPSAAGMTGQSGFGEGRASASAIPELNLGAYL